MLDNSRLLALVLGVLIITGEYRHKTVTPTFLAEPRRGRVVTAKLGIGFGAGIVMGALTMLAGLVLGLVLVGREGALLRDLRRRRAGHVAGGVLGAHGPYYVANTHDMWHDWSQIAPGVILGRACSPSTASVSAPC